MTEARAIWRGEYTDFRCAYESNLNNSDHSYALFVKQQYSGTVLVRVHEIILM